MMDDMYRQAHDLLKSGERFLLATVVHTVGSTPQKAGAKAIIFPDGRILGTLGGGCLEAASRRQALECLRLGRRELLELTLDGDFGFDDGLICGGSAKVFLDPNVSASHQALQSLVEAMEARIPAVLITVVAPEGPALGRRLLHTAATPAGPFAQAAEEAAARDAALLRTVPTSEGDLTLYLEPILPRPILLITGAGHVGRALCHLGAMLDFEVVVVDDRPSFANQERLPEASRVIVADIPSAVRDFPIGPDTYVVIVTRGHRHDGEALRESLGRQAAYVGMIGSRRKVLLIYRDLIQEGHATPELLETVHSPIGLDIGAVTVEEIAVSIASELVMIRRGAVPAESRTPVPMKALIRE
jgi:xanthine dehydrogenase accessory factor